MEDEAHYEDPLTFKGFRFVHPEGKTISSGRFSGVSMSYLFWGGPKRPCPGRFYVSVVAKMILSDFILNYDLKLVDSNTPRLMAWGFSRFPHPSTRLLLRKRTGS